MDEHPLMREALALLLQRLRPGVVVIELPGPAHLDEAIARRGPPRLFCMDLKWQAPHGLGEIQRIRQRHPITPLLVFSALPASQMRPACMAAGADAYVEKTASSSQLAEAFNQIMAPSVPEACAPPAPGALRLSRRHQQLIAMLEQGLPNRDIAAQLGISEHTVKVHLWRLFRRLDVRNRTQAVHFARQNGLL